MLKPGPGSLSAACLHFYWQSMGETAEPTNMLCITSGDGAKKPVNHCCLIAEIADIIRHVTWAAFH